MRNKEWQSLDDRILLQELHAINQKDRQALCLFLRGLAEAEKRALHLHMGYPNLFEFCRVEFGLSEGCIYRRIQVARQVLSFPQLLEALASGAINLTLASMLCPHLGTTPWDRLLNAVEGQSKRAAHKALVDLLEQPLDGEKVPSARVRYAGREAYHYRLRIPATLHHDLERAREILSHQIGDGDWVDVLDTLVRSYLMRHDPQQAAPLRQDFWESYQSSQRYIPRGLKQKLLEAAQFRCQYQSPEGQRCPQTRYLDVDHIVPMARGGKTELKNLQILCRAHNAWKGDRLVTDHNRSGSVVPLNPTDPLTLPTLKERFLKEKRSSVRQDV